MASCVCLCLCYWCSVWLSCNRFPAYHRESSKHKVSRLNKHFGKAHVVWDWWTEGGIEYKMIIWSVMASDFHTELFTLSTLLTPSGSMSVTVEHHRRDDMISLLGCKQTFSTLRAASDWRIVCKMEWLNAMYIICLVNMRVWHHASPSWL